MRHIKSIALLLLCVSLLLPLMLSVQKETKADAAGEGNFVRIGLAVPENSSTLRVASMNCDAGFRFGSSTGNAFASRFELSETGIAIIPDRNYSVQVNNGRATGRASDSGNYGAYHVLVSGGYSSYSAAKSAAAASGGFVAYDGSCYEVRKGNYFSKEEAAKNGTATEPVSGGVAILDLQTGKLLLEYTGTSALAFCGKNERDVLIYTNSDVQKSYPGFFEISSVPNIRIINVLELETYVKCVMANEIGTNQTKETRRAFSVLVRTVPMEHKHSAHGYDVCSSSCCQAYMGNYRRDAENDSIVDSTKGEYVAYRGKPIVCLYHNSNGGTSCSSVAAWGGEEIPYLVSVALPENENNPGSSWQKVFTKEEFNDYIHSRSAFSALTGTIEEMTIESTDPYGSSYVTLLSVKDSKGNVVYTENAMPIRGALGVQSGNFTLSYTMNAPIVNADGTVTQEQAEGYVDAQGEYHAFSSFAETFSLAGTNESRTPDLLTMDGHGTGHGVGFSSNGSEILASQGYSYRYILGFYYPGTEIKKLS